MAGPETDSAKPKPEAAKTSAASSGDATKYVGTPAVGTSKAAAAGGLATVGPEPSEINRKRRRLVWVTVTGFLGAWFIAFLRFFRSEEHTSELQSRRDLVCRLLLEKKKFGCCVKLSV